MQLFLVSCCGKKQQTNMSRRLSKCTTHAATVDLNNGIPGASDLSRGAPEDKSTRQDISTISCNNNNNNNNNNNENEKEIKLSAVDNESRWWLWIFFPISWTTQIGHGLVNTIVGPTQPYLAKNTGVAIDTINFVWTFGFLGFLTGSIVSGFVFQQYIKSSRGKLIFLFANICTAGILTAAMPWTSSFAVLAALSIGRVFCIGAYLTAESTLIVSLLGPEKSAPFILLEHATIGPEKSAPFILLEHATFGPEKSAPFILFEHAATACGSFVATFLVRPFLPAVEHIDKEAICDRMVSNITTEETLVGGLEEISASLLPDEVMPEIHWPFIISGAWCAVFSLGFVILAYLPYPMPAYHSQLDKSKKDEVQQHKKSSTGANFIIVALTFAMLYSACAIERIYQPMATTFGLCGPLDLMPAQAAATDSFYNGGFMCGRLVSLIAVRFLTPRSMIIISLINCVLAAILLSVLAGTSVYGLYIGTAWIGFFLSWQFGATYSWVATKVDITGKFSSFPFIACGLGSLVTPPLVGFIFTSSLGPMWIIYLTLIFCLVECVLFLAMVLMAKSLLHPSSPQNIPAL